MEILRFEEATPTAPKRKKSSKGYLTLGFVAALFSVGSAFATTTSSIKINEGATISLGQGITTFTSCDDFIAVLPVTKLNEDADNFVLDKVTIGASYGGLDKYLIDYNDKDAIAPDPAGCGGVDFVIKFYKGTSGNALDVCTNFTGVSDATVYDSFRCFSDGVNSRIIFKVSKPSHNINFGEAVGGTSFFDRISIETTSGTNYDPRS